MRKQRKLRSVTQLRGSNTVSDRVPFRRISIEIPEALWARLKNVGLDTNTPLSRLLSDAASEIFGTATEDEIVALYRTMSGFPAIKEEEPIKPPANPPQSVFGSFSVDTGYTSIPSVPIEPEKKDRPIKDDLKTSKNILKKKFKSS